MTERTIHDFSLGLFSLAGARAIVTGGNSGLGQAFALALAKAGADVHIPTVVDDDGATAALLRAEGVRCVEQQVDLTEPGAPAAVIARCVEGLGGVDIVVNNAGISRLSDDVRDFDRAAWDPMVAVNLTAAFELSHEAAKVLIPRGPARSSTSARCSPSWAVAAPPPTPRPSTASPASPGPSPTSSDRTESR